MPDHLADLSRLARERVRRGYYDSDKAFRRTRQSLVKAIRNSDRTPVITEIKYASPSSGKIRDFESPLRIAKAMLSGGACALSVLTDPESFQGGLNVLAEVAEQASVPIIMKDIIVSPRQLRAGAGAGADVVVLISELFSRGLTDAELDETVEEARRNGLEVLVEANGALEFEKMRNHSPDLYGINNRNLLTLQVDLDTTERILSKTRRLDRPVVSESGIESARDIRRLKTAGAQAFLVGTSIMKSANVESKVRELVNA